MKTMLTLLSALLLLLSGVSDALAVTCAQGVYRKGCAGPNGAVVAPKAPVVVAPAKPVVVVPRAPVVVAPANPCRIVNGVRICR